MDCETLDKSRTLNIYPWGLFNNMLKSVRNFVVSNAVDLVILKLSCVNYQFSHSVVSDSSWPHESQHAGPPCPSPTPWVHPNSCASSQWCHPAISSSVIPFSSCSQSLPTSGSFPVSQLFAWGGQSIGVSASASVLPKNTQDWSPLGWTGWISLAVQGTLKSLLKHHSSKASILQCSAFSVNYGIK